MGNDDKAATLLDRILSYGDVAVAQGNAATQTKVVPPQTPPPPPPVDVIMLILIDRRSLVPDATRLEVKTRLDRDLNALGEAGRQPHILKSNGLRFEARWESKMPVAAQQDSYGKWEFPLYFERAHTSDNRSASEVLSIMQAHGIRNAGRSAQEYKDAEDGWKDKAVEGLGINPLEGYRKVGFVKVDKVSGPGRDPETGYTNVVKHELGHMLKLGHSGSGLMMKSVPIFDDKAQFAPANRAGIFTELLRLKRSSEADLQRDYEAANR